MDAIAARVDRLTERLVEHFFEAAVIPHPMLRWEWLACGFEDPTGANRPFGWVPPFTTEGTHPDHCRCAGCRDGDDVEMILAPFCPELIVEQTAHLDDDQFEQYIDVIDYCTSLHIVHRHKPPIERQRIVDSCLYDQAPGSM